MPVYKKPNKIAVKFVDFSPLIYVSLLSFVSLLYRRKACLVLSLYMYTVYIYIHVYIYICFVVYLCLRILYTVFLYSCILVCISDFVSYKKLSTSICQ